MTRVGIVGYRGYSGEELVRILGRHGHVEPVLMEHREDGGHRPAIRRSGGPARVACTPEAVRGEGLKLVFLATPPEVSMGLAPAMLAVGARVVDLSGAFRLRTPENYAAWYKEPHTQPELLAVLGVFMLMGGIIQTAVQPNMQRLMTEIQVASGASPELLSRFVAKGMLLNVMASMDALESDEPWAVALREGCLAPLT